MTTFTQNVGVVKTITAAAIAADLTPGKLWGNAIPTWSAPSGSGVTIVPAANGYTAQVSGATPGSYVITVSSQDPTGAPVVGTFTLVVNQENAVTFSFTSN